MKQTRSSRTFFTIRTYPGERADQDLPRIRRIDHVIDLEYLRGTQRLAPGVMLGDELVVAGPSGLRIGDRVEFGPEAQPHRALQAHPAELAAGPGHGERGVVQIAAGHGHRAEPVGLAQDDGAYRHAQPGAGDEHRAE